MYLPGMSPAQCGSLWTEQGRRNGEASDGADVPSEFRQRAPQISADFGASHLGATPANMAHLEERLT